jgi:hypothetical protein
MDKAEARRLLDLADDPPPTLEQITRAYHERARRYHPDHNPDKGVATDILQRINEAYAILTGKQEEDVRKKEKPPAAAARPMPPAAAEWLGRMCNDLEYDLRSHPELKNIPSEVLQRICTKHGIKLAIIHERTLRPNKKTRAMMFRDIRRLREYADLKAQSYERLVEMCAQKNIPINLGKTGKGMPKSVYELIADLLDAE